MGQTGRPERRAGRMTAARGVPVKGGGRQDRSMFHMKHRSKRGPARFHVKHGRR
jgi:hypothetical protein